MHKSLFYIIVLVSLISLKGTYAGEADKQLTTGDLAKFFNITWASYDIPGEPNELFKVGVMIEFGDERKPIKSGTMSPIAGGSVIKLMIRPEENKLEYSIIATKPNGAYSSSGGKLKYPKEFHKNKMHSSGPVDNLTNWYILKASSKNKSLASHSPLEKNELGVRLYFEPQKD